jgi:hypothetical protein
MVMQEAPFPDELADLVAHLRYRPGWTFTLLPDHVRDRDAEGNVTSRGLTLDIVTLGYDSYHPERGETYGVHHYRIVPPATFNRQSWQRWLLDQVLAVEQHEACEFFALATPCEGSRRTGPTFEYNTCGSLAAPVMRHPDGAESAVSRCPDCGMCRLPDAVTADRPFAPNHGPGFDPYRIVEYETDAARRTSFRGTLNP